MAVRFCKKLLNFQEMIIIKKDSLDGSNVVKSFLYLGDDNFGFPIYEEVYTISIDQSQVLEISKNLNMTFSEVKEAIFSHEEGHIFSNSVKNSELENEVAAWDYATSKKNIPKKLIRFCLESYNLCQMTMEKGSLPWKQYDYASRYLEAKNR